LQINQGPHNRLETPAWQERWKFPITRQIGSPMQRSSEVFGSERLTGAILDRLTHHVHILEMNGDSYRLRQSRRAKA
jgi:hypothetical protein